MDRVLHLQKGRYLARTASGGADLAAALGLRSRCFGFKDGNDTDRFDADCTHILVEDTQTSTVVCAFRVLPLATGPDILRSYSAQFYDLTALTHFQGPLLEIGRFCIHPDHHDPDILRVAWGALTQWVDATGVRLLFGCSSFLGDDATLHRAAFQLLQRKHRAPARWNPHPKAPERFSFSLDPYDDHICGAATLPPLLRTYLMMGGWVSDHAVFDRQLHTMHVFTGVEIASIPAARARLLRAVAG
ncbi:GNAT family N-acetyltransferase [Pseudorhodobacter ferrugineus]|uniref:GNAT family N-acetyltransferase n=1 Tax=Pseudorhodobacter ferrugineus TaxID=77008 RepID=UPI0003B3A088|nr:GNAT family N-acetyltransferase [Pseudorhodobacter ferrugineus]